MIGRTRRLDGVLEEPGTKRMHERNHSALLTCSHDSSSPVAIQLGKERATG